MKRGGRIIMIGSAVGERVLFLGRPYVLARKGAVKIFSQSLSRGAWEPGIHGQQRSARSDRH